MLVRGIWFHKEGVCFSGGGVALGACSAGDELANAERREAGILSSSSSRGCTRLTAIFFSGSCALASIFFSSRALAQAACQLRKRSRYARTKAKRTGIHCWAVLKLKVVER